MRRDGYYAGMLWLWLDIRNSAWFGKRELPCVQDDHACLAALATLWEKAKAEISAHTPKSSASASRFRNCRPPMRANSIFCRTTTAYAAKCELITNTIDRLNRKFGKRVVTLGAWTPPPGGYAGGKIAYNRIPSAEDFW